MPRLRRSRGPTTDQELLARVATLEADLDVVVLKVNEIDVRVTALEDGGTPEPGPEPEPEPGERTPLTVIIDYCGVVSTLPEIDAEILGDYFDPEGEFVQHCRKATAPEELRDFTVHIRPDADGLREEVVFELGSVATGNAPFSMLEYQATIMQGETVLYAATIKNQHYRTRWRWYSAERPVRTEIAPLIAAGLLPPYVEDLATQCPPSQAFTYEPMGFAGVTKAMGSTGDRPDIGPLTECQADYVCTGRNLATVMAQAEASGSFPWHYRDGETNAPLDAYAKLNASSYNSSNPNPYLATQWALNGDNPDRLDNIQCDVAHHPNLAYLPFLLTGDPYYLEEAQNIVIYCITSQPWNGRMYDIYFAIRAHAWAARSTACTVIITPDDVPQWLLPKGFFQRYLDDNRDWMLGTYLNQPLGRKLPEIAAEALRAYGLERLIGADPRGPEGSAVAWERFATTERSFGDNDESPSAPQGTYSQTYMEEFEAFVICWIVMLGFDDWRPIAEWKIQNTIARTSGTSGWCRAYSTPYREILRPAADQPWCADWAASWALTAERYGFVVSDPDTIPAGGNDITYPTYTEAALAMAMQLEIADACDPHAWIHGQVDNLIAGSSGRFRARRWCVAAGD